MKGALQTTLVVGTLAMVTPAGLAAHAGHSGGHGAPVALLILAVSLVLLPLVGAKDLPER